MKLLARFGISLFVFTLCCVAPVLAREYCPAYVSPPHAFEGTNSGVYSFALRADSARTVSATILAKTSSGWYTLSYSNVTIVQRVDHRKLPEVVYDAVSYWSQPLYARFPPSTVIERYAVVMASSRGDAMGWDGLGQVTCLGTFEPAVAATASSLGTEGIDLLQPPPDAQAVATAVAVSPPPLDCATPFKAARAFDIVQPDYPRELAYGYYTTVDALVSLNAQGVIEDAVVVKPSGIAAIDASAIKAAKATHYEPATAFCRPVPSHYIFRVTFGVNDPH